MKHYSGFLPITDATIHPHEEQPMYEKLHEIFTMCHAVFSTIVSTSSFRVDLATSFKSEKDPDVSLDSDATTVTADDATTDDAATDASVTDAVPVLDNNARQKSIIHRKEKACLEYFLGLIRLRSQKQLPHWSMISPLAHHCKSYLQLGTKNPLVGVGCNIKTAWNKLDGIFERCTPARMALIKNQLTITCVFDNWQRLINKLWQDMGKSGVFHRGTAYFVKQDKAFALPHGTMMTSPAGFKFWVLSCVTIDIYSYIIFGALVPFPLKECNMGLYDDWLEEIQTITDEGFTWPRIGWRVDELPGVKKCQAIKYGVEQHVPAPLGARVSNDVSADELLLQKRSFVGPDNTNSCIIPSAEAHSLFVRAQRLNELTAHANHLRDRYAMADEIAQQREEEGE